MRLMNLRNGAEFPRVLCGRTDHANFVTNCKSGRIERFAVHLQF